MVVIPNYDKLNTKLTEEEKKEEAKKRPYQVLHPFFQNVSRLLIAGPSGSGKTNLLMHILLSPLIYYEKIIIYTKTPDQPKMKELDRFFKKIAKDNKIGEFHEFKSREVEPVEKLDKETYKIVIFDDYITQKKEMNTITEYFILGRHHLISPIFLSQSYYATPKNIRINCSHFCIFNVGTKREVRSILQDHNNLTEQQYRDNTEGHDFIAINKIQKVIKKNLDEELN